MRYIPLLTTLLLTLNLSAMGADDKATIDSLLTFPLIDARVPQDEVEKFCEPKVGRVPIAKSVESWETAVGQVTFSCSADSQRSGVRGASSSFDTDVSMARRAKANR